RASRAGRRVRRDLGRAAGRRGRDRAARFRLAHPRLLDRGARYRPDSSSDPEPRVPRLPRALRRLDRDRLAPLRRTLRPLRGTEPRDPVERAERALATPVDAPVRLGDLPALPGPGRTGRAPAGTHGDRRGQLAPPGGLGGAMGVVAMGRVRIPLVLAGIFLLLAGTACGERTEPTGALVQVYPVTAQGAGDRPAVVNTVPRRIVPLGAGPR